MTHHRSSCIGAAGARFPLIGAASRLAPRRTLLWSRRSSAPGCGRRVRLVRRVLADGGARAASACSPPSRRWTSSTSAGACARRITAMSCAAGLPRDVAHARGHDGRQAAAARVHSRSTSASASSRGSTCAAVCGSSTRSTSTRRSRTSATSTTRTCAASSPRSSACIKGDEAPDRGRPTRSCARRWSSRRRATRSTRHQAHTSSRRRDPSKIDQRFLGALPQRAVVTPAARIGEPTSSRSGRRSRPASASAPSARPREIIHRRVDELGLREAAVSTRDEDIIVEVPGEDEKGFATIREIISQTARLEFKLLDDDTDFFAPGPERGQGGSPARRARVPGRRRSRSAPTKLETFAAGRTTFAVLNKLPKETMQQTLQRFREWVATLDAPPIARSATRSSTRRSTR